MTYNYTSAVRLQSLSARRMKENNAVNEWYEDELYGAVYSLNLSHSFLTCHSGRALIASSSRLSSIKERLFEVGPQSHSAPALKVNHYESITLDKIMRTYICKTCCSCICIRQG